MIRAVCFDLYETLVTEAGILKPHKDVWAERLGLPAAPFWAAWNGALHAMQPRSPAWRCSTVPSRR
jgi:hypothetical protein